MTANIDAYFTLDVKKELNNCLQILSSFSLHKYCGHDISMSDFQFMEKMGFWAMVIKTEVANILFTNVNFVKYRCFLELNI